MAADPPVLTRRAALARMGGAAVAASLGGCATTASAAPPARALGGPFVPPRIDPRLVVRTLVGLRPYRPSGFVVRGERVGDKVVVHNYGHGGGGITLSWGSSALAVREAPDVADRRAAVLGAGIMGLTTARLLQRRGWDVTIYTRDLPPHTTSNIAGGQWVPTSVFDGGRVDAAFRARFHEAASLAHHAFAGLVGPRYGVRWLENYYLDAGGGAPFPVEDMPELFHAAERLGPGRHPFGSGAVYRLVTMMVEPSIFLDRVLSDVREAGGRVVVRPLARIDDVLGLDEPVVFNCTGLGAAALFGDAELTPVRGQLLVLPPDERVDYATVGGGRGVLYMFPRSDGLLLGGTFDRGDDDRSVRADDTRRILSEHQRIFQAMRAGGGPSR